MEQTEQPILPTTDEVAGLMQTVLRELRTRMDTTQWAVDTLVTRNGTTIRHHYAGGECSLALMRPGRDTHRIQWDNRHELPIARQVVDEALQYARD